jgi:hypothetical protein
MSFVDSAAAWRWQAEKKKLLHFAAKRNERRERASSVLTRHRPHVMCMIEA